MYEYDNAGNILKTYTFDNTGPNVQHWMDVYPALGEITEAYTYSDSAWGDLLTNYNGTAISYDSIGNPTNWIGIAGLYWDGRELDSITIANNHTVDYTYNSDGIRTRKYELNNTDQYLYDHTYVLDGSKILKETILYSSAFNGNSTTTLEYYYDESGISSFRYNGTVYHYIKNLQGDVIGIVNSSNGGIVVEYTYDAWGNILSITGELASTVGQINPFRYRGYYYDSETDLYYLNSRYYDPQVGRFINADVYISTGEGLRGYNMFAYCLNNPVSRIDAYGADSVSVTVDDDDNPLDDMGYPGSGIGGGAGGSGYVGGSGSVGSVNLPAASTAGSSFIGGSKTSDPSTVESHGNSSKSTRSQHLYRICDSSTGKTAKYGISGRPLNKNGTSNRANTQVNSWNRSAGYNQYYAEVLIYDIPNRAIALFLEFLFSEDYRSSGEELPMQKRP